MSGINFAKRFRGCGLQQAVAGEGVGLWACPSHVVQELQGHQRLSRAAAGRDRLKNHLFSSS